MIYLKTLAGFMIWLSLASAAAAQSEPTEKKSSEAPSASSRGRTGSPRERGRRGFGGGAPKVGDMLPDAAGFDAQGKEFRLQSLRGQYSVLVFGCLT